MKITNAQKNVRRESVLSLLFLCAEFNSSDVKSQSEFY